MKKIHVWFTLIELLVGLLFIALWLLTIIWLMRASIAYTDKTRQETLAINLAREGMETVYTIRNTNRLRRSGKKDENRLCANPSVESDSTQTSCWAWMQSGTSYIMRTISAEQQYIALNPISGQQLNNADGEDNSFALRYYKPAAQNVIGWYHSQWFTGSNNEGKFFREIRGLWLYQKDSNIVWWNPITCTQWTNTYTAVTINGTPVSNQPCSDSRPKEFRFCSKVEYQKQMKWKVELCGVLTNYEE